MSTDILGGVLAACDLDGTLIYSSAALHRYGNRQHHIGPLVCVEYHRNRPSYLTARAAHHVAELANTALLVPATTRTPHQYARVQLPGPSPRYAVCSNGAHLLCNGVPDPEWHRETRRRVNASAAPLPEVSAHLQHALHRNWPITVRVTEQMFLYVVTSPGWSLPTGWINDLTHWAHAHGWQLSTTGRKVHLVPAALSKSAAITELASRTRARLVLAAGDSLLDVDMLRHADIAIHPAHGELAATGWSHPTVTRTRTTGVRAGEEILRWLHATATPYGRGRS
ncbi:MAG: HAD family hydrolase [Pseudonocardiales bacterium]|nr:HAD family hydrolase [Pseudonocardiales bacterium]